MPFGYNKEIEAILKPRVEPGLLEGYYGGEFITDRNKLYAATLIDISTINYDDFEYLHTTLNGHSITYCDEEESRKYITPNSFQYKSVRECIEENIYKYFSISFVGILFKNEWFILKQLTFYGDEAIVSEVKKHIENLTPLKHDSLFLPKTPFEHEVKGEKILLREVTYEEFKDEPYLVALIKQMRKEKINTAFTSYFQEEYLLPFFQKLRVSFSEEFEETCQLRSNYTLIFPQHKKFVLFVALVKNNSNKWQLKYFLFIQKSGHFYQWTYFTSDNYDFCFFYEELIIDDLKQISDWNYYAFLDSSCTMDDENFWKNYIFKKDNEGGYLYLKTIDFLP